MIRFTKKQFSHLNQTSAAKSQDYEKIAETTSHNPENSIYDRSNGRELEEKRVTKLSATIAQEIWGREHEQECV